MYFWLVVGSVNNWETAFQHGNIWGLRETQYSLWQRLNENDIVFFYATLPVGGVIGYGKVRTKIKQDKPLWPQEIREHRVIWPLRFEFDVESCLSIDKWAKDKVILKVLNPRGGFQLIHEGVAEDLLALLNAREYMLNGIRIFPVAEEGSDYKVDMENNTEDSLSHKEIQKSLVEIGKMQKFIAEPEYPVDIGRLDVVWRRVELSVPTYVFEVQVGGDIYNAISKLKHAYDLWNSHIYIVANQMYHNKVENLLSGTFHEIGSRLKFIDLMQVDELYKRKKSYMDFERELGIF